LWDQSFSADYLSWRLAFGVTGINSDRTIKFVARFVAVIGGDSTTTITFATPASDILLDRF
jgi:hypothetical protein